MKKIYLLDFDGTISDKDSFILFSWYAVSVFAFIRYWCYTSINYLLSAKSNATLKEFFFLSNFKNFDAALFNTICNHFEKDKVVQTIKNSFQKYIEKIDNQSTVVVISASVSNYLQPWCDRMGFDLIATELEVVDGRLTGQFSTPNCNGKEKVRRIKEKYDLSNYEEIHVFGNSEGDRPMLALGTHQYYQYFK